MTDEPNEGSSPPEQPSGAGTTPPTPPAPWTPPPDAQLTDTQPFEASAETTEPTPAVEPTDAGISAPAQSVARDSGTFGAETPTGRRSSGVRWAIALGGIAIVVGVTAAILALAGGRPATSIAVGYMPANTVMYSEYRLDLPGDQRAKLAGFLSAFPGFEDQSTIEPKLNEVFDRLVKAISQDKQTYTADIAPWFGDQIAMGSGPATANQSGMVGMSPFGGGSSLIVISIEDRAKAVAWIKSTAGDALTEGDYNGATTFSSGSDFEGAPFIAVNDEVILAGTDAAVRAAVDSKGDGKLAEDDEFRAAFGAVSRDYVVFSYVEYKALLQSTLALMGSGSGLDATTVDDELVSMIPSWFAYVARFENDALAGEATYPSVDFGFDAKNKRSTLVGHAPPGTLFYAESHDVGAAVTAMLNRFRQMPDLREAFAQIDQAANLVGGVDGTIGWWGDAAVVVTKAEDGQIGGGLLIAPTDLEAAKRTVETLRSALIFAGGSAGIEIRDVEHGGVTVTIVDFSEAAGSSLSLPPGYKPEIAYAIANDVLVVGYGEAFVNAVIDAGPGPSLADDARFKDLAKRIGDETVGMSFIDIRAIRELLEPLAKADSSPETWAQYEKELRPYILPLDAIVSGARVDGDLDRWPASITVQKP